MAQGVGGDYYHVREYEPGKWFFCLCDISGKGISAAIITAVLSGFMYNADFAMPLEDLVGRLNRIILDTFKLEKYLTGFFARFSEKTGELEYCDMGHSFFYAVESDTIQQVAEIADNCPVGLIDAPEITPRTLRIAPGTVLVLLSDGIIEQENREGETWPIGELGQCVGQSIKRGEDMVRAKIRILESFYAFKKDMPQHDDISLLLFHYLDPDSLAK
jgi:sigma-B regulation protein RsbU (phosphoserine phosphatase)